MNAPQADSYYQSDTEASALFSSINITPLVDIMLVLVIILMVGSGSMVDALNQGQLDVALPSASHAQTRAQNEAIDTIALKKDGSLYLNNQQITSDMLQQQLQKIYQNNSNHTIVIDADGQLAHEQVINLIDRVRAIGFLRIGLGTQAPP